MNRTMAEAIAFTRTGPVACHPLHVGLLFENKHSSLYRVSGLKNVPPSSSQSGCLRNAVRPQFNPASINSPYAVKRAAQRTSKHTGLYSYTTATINLATSSFDHFLLLSFRTKKVGFWFITSTVKTEKTTQNWHFSLNRAGLFLRFVF